MKDAEEAATEKFHHLHKAVAAAAPPPMSSFSESGLNGLNQQVEGRTRGRGVEVCIAYKQMHA